MRRISFNMTVDAILSRRKTVTRRLGWRNLKAGERLLAVDRLRSKDAMALGVIEVVDVRRETLSQIKLNPLEVIREGFDAMSAWQFIEAFCAAMKCEPSTEVTRIEFRYVDEGPAA